MPVNFDLISAIQFAACAAAQMAAMKAQMEAALSAQNQTAVPCAQCDTIATLYCGDCSADYCGAHCQYVHALQRDHNVMRVEQKSGFFAHRLQLQREELHRVQAQRHHCVTHPDQPKNLHCMTCEEVVCPLCAEAAHQGHSTTTVAAGATNVRVAQAVTLQEMTSCSDSGGNDRGGDTLHNAEQLSRRLKEMHSGLQQRQRPCMPRLRTPTAADTEGSPSPPLPCSFPRTCSPRPDVVVPVFQARHRVFVCRDQGGGGRARSGAATTAAATDAGRSSLRDTAGLRTVWGAGRRELHRLTALPCTPFLFFCGHYLFFCSTRSQTAN